MKILTLKDELTGVKGHDLTNAQGKPLEVVFGWQKPVAGYDFQLTGLGG